MATRFDAWTEEQDRLLVETVLRHVRGGSTQINAFDEAGEAMNRTAAACGFRWTATLRPKHAEELESAKRLRRQLHLRGGLGISPELMKNLTAYAAQTWRTADEVAEEAIKDYLQGVGAK